jgi:hypothetical protein
MKKLLLYIFLPFVLLGQTPVHDILLNPTDTTTSTVSGTLNIVSSAMQVNGSIVVKTLTPYKIVAGVVTLTLAPNDTSTNLGSYYTVNYSVNQVGNAKVTTNYSEKWVVPTSVSPLTISQVRVTTVTTTANTIILASQITAGPNGTCLSSNGTITSWTTCAGSGGSGTIAWANVKASPFNAAGNGTTIDTAAVQAAITSLDKNHGGTGGVVYFPAGTYPVCGLVLGDHVSFYGDGWVSIVTLAPGCNGDEFISPTGFPVAYFSFHNLNLTGNDGNNTSGSAVSITATGDNHSDIYWDNVLINHFAGDCLYVESGFQYHIQGGTIIEACGGALLHVAPQGNTNLTGTYRWFIENSSLLWNNTTGNTSQDGIIFAGGNGKLLSNININGNHIGNNDIQKNAIHLTSATAFEISGNRIGGGSQAASNTYAGILVDDDGVAASTLGVISGNLFSSGNPPGANGGNKENYNVSIQGLSSNIALGTNEYSGYLTAPLSIAGTVSNVGPSIVANAPITISPTGTIACATCVTSAATQAANAIFAGPTTGAAATPTWRALVAADIPSLSYEPVIYILSALPATPPTGTLAYCTDCKNVQDDSVLFDSNIVGSGSGTLVVYENGHWRVH